MENSNLLWACLICFGWLKLFQNWKEKTVKKKKASQIRAGQAENARRYRLLKVYFDKMKSKMSKRTVHLHRSFFFTGVGQAGSLANLAFLFDFD